MTRKTIADMKVEIAALLPDNNTGAISPADVRGVLSNMLDSLNTVLAMAYGQPNAIMATTATPVRIPGTFFTAATNDDINVLAARITPEGDIAVNSGVGQLNISFDVTLSGGNNVQYDFRLAKNGVALPLVARESTQGAGNPVTVVGSWLVIDPAIGDIFTILISTPDGNSSPTIAGCAIKAAMFPSVS